MKTLHEIYNKESAQEGFGDKGTMHNYIDYYAAALEPYRNTKNTILEIGVAQGHSLRMWREYFPDAKIVGVDIDDHRADCPGCEIKIGDATKPATFDGYDNFDVVIDDGSHFLENQITTFLMLWPKVNPGGVYIIEDIVDIDLSARFLLGLHPNVQIFDFRPITNRFDDVIVEIRKAYE